MEFNQQLSLFDEFNNNKKEPSEKKEPSKVKIETTKEIEENKVSLLALAEIPGVGFATIRKLFDIFHGNLSQIWDINKKELFEAFSNSSNQPQQIIDHFNTHTRKLKEIAIIRLQHLKQRKIDLVFRDNPAYPKSLYSLKSAPYWLFIEGNPELLHDQSIIAVIGTREPSKMGIEAAKRLSILLVTSGCIILSGLAEGIDEIGHRTAVDYGVPTIAVLGHGINVIFPAKTADLRQKIVDQGGAVISEYLPNDSYSGDKFVQRNRIQAAMSKTVAIIEGKSKSGTAHTLRFAQELQKPVFGVRITPLTKLPQQELLTDLIKQNYPVFSIIDREERTLLRSFLRQQYPQETRIRDRNPHLFYGILKESERIIQDYDARPEEVEWLIEELIQYRNRLRKM